MSLSRVATLDAVKLQEFLNTVVKSIAEHRGGPSRVKLIEQTKRSYFPESTERNTELNDEITQVEDIFIHAAHESMDAVKFEQTFKSTDLSSGQKKIFIDTWNTNKEQIRRSVALGSLWTYTLSASDSIQWRVDKGVSSSQAGDSAPALTGASTMKCLLNLKLRGGAQVCGDGGDGDVSDSRSLQLELSKAQVDDLLATLETIQQQIDTSA